MSADFESGFFGAGERAWHGLGTVIEQDSVPTREALTLAGLDWTVEKMPMFVDGLEAGYETVPDFNAIQRQSDGRVLGVVGEYYEPIQNEDAFSFMDEVLGGEAKWHTAGSLAGGRIVWMLAYLPGDAMVAGEAHKRFVFLTHRHDGKGAVRVAPTAVRIVCRNTLRMAVDGAKNMWTARHTASFGQRMSEAQRTIGLSAEYFDRFAQAGERLATAKMSSKAFAAFLDQLVPLPTGENVSDRKVTNTEAVRVAIRDLYENAPNLANVRGTKWAAFNAAAEWNEWVRPVRATKIGDADEQRFSRVMIGDPQGNLTDKALAILTA